VYGPKDLLQHPWVLLCSPCRSWPQAQPAVPPSGRLWRVGILFQADTGRGGPYLEAILQGFRDLGYVEGRNLKIEWRSAGGDLTRLPYLAHELVRLPVDVIMTPLPGIEPAMAATTTIPIVMLSSADPVKRGLVKSVAQQVTSLAWRSCSILVWWQSSSRF